MSGQSANFESLLQRAFAPVEPPVGFENRVERACGSIVEMAAEELDGWELSAMKNPRNWLRPVAALIAGGGAAVGLAIVETHQRRRRRHQQLALQAAKPSGIKRLWAHQPKVSDLPVKRIRRQRRSSL